MSEFLEVVETFSPISFPVGEVIVPAELFIHQRAKILDCYPLRADEGCQSTPPSHDGFRVKLGIFRTEEQWLDHAKGLEHPFDSVKGLRPDVQTISFMTEKRNCMPQCPLMSGTYYRANGWPYSAMP
eukprot:191859-Amphidinium_carterae.1